MAKSSRQLSRRLGARLVAWLGIVLAVSWGPLSHTLKFLEVSESGEHSVRVVLASDYSRLQAKKTAQDAKKDCTKPDSKDDGSKTERLLNAVPDTLEAAQAIHFELNAAPHAPELIVFIATAETRHAAYAPLIAESPPPDQTLARGPPLA